MLLSKARGKITLLHIVALSVLMVMCFVAVFLYLPSAPDSNADVSVPADTESAMRLPALPIEQKPKQHTTIPTPEIKSTTSLGFCAEQDLEVVGFEWDPGLAAAKTRSANSTEVNAELLTNTPAFHHYMNQNQKSRYAEYLIFLGESTTFDAEIEYEIIIEIEDTKLAPEGIRQLAQKYANDRRFLINILAMSGPTLDADLFLEVVASYGDIDYEFMFKLLTSDFAVNEDYITWLLARIPESASISNKQINRGNQLLFKALLNGNTNYLPYILDMNINVIPSQDASLFFALSNGAMRKSESASELAALKKQIEILVGPPSFNDLISMSLGFEDNLLDKLIEYGFNVEEHLTYLPNLDILDMTTETLEEKLSYVAENWPLYIIRINPNSDCANASEFHWTKQQLFTWYNERVKTDDDFAEADEALSAISRLYVARAHVHYYSGQLSLTPKEFRIDEYRDFFEAVIGQIFEPLNQDNASASERLTALSNEVNTPEKQQILRFYLISLTSNVSTLDASTNLGFVYDENDMVAAIRSQNQKTIAWLMKNGVGLNGSDDLNNGVLVWLVLNKSNDFLTEVQLESIPTLYNSNALSPHELHYLQCENYGYVSANFRRTDLGKDIKQQINTPLCETFSGYNSTVANPEF